VKERGREEANGAKGNGEEPNGNSSNSAQKPEIPTIQPLRRPLSLTALCVLGLIVLASFYTFYFARAFFLPLTLAWILSLILKPIVRYLHKLHIPEALGAAIVLLSVLGLLVGGIFFLAAPASKWMSRAPAVFEKLQGKLDNFRRPAEKISKAAEQVENLTHLNSQEASAQKVQVKEKGLLSNAMTLTKGVLLVASETFVLLYFLLAAGDLLMLKLIQVLPTLQDKKRAVEIANETESQVSSFLGTMTLINIFEGTVVGIGLAILGMPNPVLWGVMAAMVNYIPYLGALVGVGIVTLAAFATFDSTGRALMAPLIYLSVNFMDNFISPYIMGKRLVLNPVLVFISLMFWGWIWGPVGVLLAVPLMVVFKVVCDHIEPLAPLGELLNGAESPHKPESAAAAHKEEANLRDDEDIPATSAAKT
jgi:predicted PurR-regulated permease PerM